jgi:hypothetical protein
VVAAPFFAAAVASSRRQPHLWRVEAVIPPSPFSGDVELVLLVNEQPVAGCHTTLRFE